MEISPKQKGLNTELHCISYFSDCGFLVSVPYGDNGRYDLIVDVNGHLLRVQVKSASPTVDNSGKISGIKFSCKSQRINTKESKTKRYSKDEIDYFATYWNYQVYVVPVEETSSSKYLRFYSSLNNQDYLGCVLDGVEHTATLDVSNLTGSVNISVHFVHVCMGVNLHIYNVVLYP